MKKFVSVLLCSLMILSCLSLSGCGSEQGNVVNVYNWGEYIDESIFEDFEAETGIIVITTPSPATRCSIPASRAAAASTM